MKEIELPSGEKVEFILYGRIEENQTFPFGAYVNFEEQFFAGFGATPGEAKKHLKKALLKRRAQRPEKPV